MVPTRLWKKLRGTRETNGAGTATYFDESQKERGYSFAIRVNPRSETMYCIMRALYWVFVETVSTMHNPG